MGIQNLIKFLNEYFESKMLSDFKNQTIGIDAHTWLHSAVNQLMSDLSNISESKVLSTIKEYFSYRIKLMKHLKITPYFVFDGDELPIKEGIEKARDERRKKNEELFKYHINSKNLKDAKKQLISSIDITPHMTKNLIDFLKDSNIKFIIAPYEADAQLAYLYNKKVIDLVLTIDSDLICYNTGKILYLSNNDFSEAGKYIEIENIFKFSTLSSHCLGNFTAEAFTILCILSGCDYTKKIKGIGINSAYLIIKNSLEQIKQLDKSNYFDYINSIIDIICNNIKLIKKKIEIGGNDKNNILKAFITFHCQLVFCPQNNKLVHLHENNLISNYIEKVDDDISFLGKYYKDSIAIKVSIGNLDPTTKNEFNNILLNNNVIKLMKEYNTSRANILNLKVKTSVFNSDAQSFKKIDSFFCKKNESQSTNDSQEISIKMIQNNKIVEINNSSSFINVNLPIISKDKKINPFIFNLNKTPSTSSNTSCKSLLELKLKNSLEEKVEKELEIEKEMETVIQKDFDFNNYLNTQDSTRPFILKNIQRNSQKKIEDKRLCYK
jgi:exonuclease-1